MTDYNTFVYPVVEDKDDCYNTLFTLLERIKRLTFVYRVGEDIMTFVYLVGEDKDDCL